MAKNTTYCPDYRLWLVISIDVCDVLGLDILECGSSVNELLFNFCTKLCKLFSLAPCLLCGLSLALLLHLESLKPLLFCLELLLPLSLSLDGFDVDFGLLLQKISGECRGH